MDIKLQRISGLSEHDTGGGIREVSAIISIDKKLTKRQKRKVAMYETLGVLLDFSLSHDQIEEITDILMDVFDTLEPI